VDDSRYDFAYALMAGASYKMTDNVSLDLGYQFLHAPDAKHLDEDTFTLRDGRARHQIRLGLRYDLW
jgi:opacity protein-like surface antigen